MEKAKAPAIEVNWEEKWLVVASSFLLIFSVANCLYCDSPGKDSISHIIPEAFGKGPTLDTGVCEKCNHESNTDVENHIIRKFSHIRNLLRLTDKRGRMTSKKG